MTPPLPCREDAAPTPSETRGDRRCSQQGLADDPTASVQDVAAACGLHRATVHRHFASREDLIHAVRVQAFSQTQVELDRLADDGTLDPMVALEKMALALFTVGDRFRIYRFTTTLGPGIDQQRDEVRAPMGVVIKRAQKAGLLRKDITAPLMVAAFGGLDFGMLPEVANGVSAKKAARTVIALMRGQSPRRRLAIRRGT